MLYFDLTLGAWVNTPGSSSTPQMEPVLTIGASYQLLVTFCRGTEIESVTGGTFYGGIKIKGDYAGTITASDSAPVECGEDAIVFTMNLDTVEGKEYFTTNPTTDIVSAVFVVEATIDVAEFKTPPFNITLQNDYFAS
jgi:hypothetical protein|tara:strand:+ start:67 stop:480 length:414 start_codon:yes stop_codon:yes gene_type:complete